MIENMENNSILARIYAMRKAALSSSSTQQTPSASQPNYVAPEIDFTVEIPAETSTTQQEYEKNERWKAIKNIMGKIAEEAVSPSSNRTCLSTPRFRTRDPACVCTRTTTTFRYVWLTCMLVCKRITTTFRYVL